MMGKDKDDDGIAVTEKDLPQRFILKILGHCETTGLWGVKHTREPVDRMVKFAKNHSLCLPIVQLVVTREGLFVLPLDLRPGKPPPSPSPPDPFPTSELLRINVTIPETTTRTSATGETVKAGSHFLRIKARFRIVRHKKGKKERKKSEEDRDGGEVCGGCGMEDHDKRVTDPSTTNRDLLLKYKAIDWRKRGVTFYPVDNISYGVQDLVYTRVFSMIEVADIGSRFRVARVPFVCHSFVCDSHNTAKLLTHTLDAAFRAYGKTLRNTRSVE